MRNRQDYLLVTWEYLESFENVSEKDIASRLGITAATASQYISALVDEGLLYRDGRSISFTLTGRRMTVPLVRMHRVSEVFAYRFLEVPWEDSHASVMELEHLFSGEKGEKLFKNLGRPLTCPHGNPTNPVERIPGISASLLQAGKYKVSRVVFEDRNLLKKLASIEAFPEREIVLNTVDGATIQSQVGEIKLSPSEAQALILVK
ncbi:MAG: metal-dependent transcriptional regulator [Thermoplasmataceae archaeon]